MSTRAGTERRLLWHPRRKNKFILGGGTQITLYEWSPKTAELRHITAQSDLQHMKCFAWSPHPAHDDLIAVGYNTGKVDLLQLEASKYARSNVVSSSPVLSLPVRSSRSCLCLAFCTASPNILAVGLDKIRGDSSLIVRDIEAAPSYLLKSQDLDTSPRASTITRADVPIIQQYATADVVSSLAFLPDSPHYLAACVSNMWLRIYDLRVPSMHVSQASTSSKVQGMVTEPSNPNRLACFGDGYVTIWDSRRMSYPLLSFTMRDASADGEKFNASDSFSSIEFSDVRRGTLATLTRDSDHIRFWNIQQTPPVELTRLIDEPRYREANKESSRTGKIGRLSWSSPLPWNAHPEPPRPTVSGTMDTHNLVLSDTYRSKPFHRGIVSFALVPDEKSNPLTSEVLVVNKEGDIEMYRMHDAPTLLTWSARGDLTAGSATQQYIFPGFSYSEPPSEPWNIDVHGKEGRSAEPSVDRRGRQKTSRPQSRLFSPDSLGFGRGDKDGFPALSSTPRESSLTASMHMKGRTYSPASLRRFPLVHPKQTDGANTLDGQQHEDETFRPEHVLHRTEPTLQIGSKSRRNNTSRSASRSHRRTSEASAPFAIENDISMLMRLRTIQGYGLQNFAHNARILSKQPNDDQSVIEIWIWLNHSKHLLTFGTSKVHGFDFSYQGVLGIWEGLAVSSSQEDFGNLEGLDLAGPSEASSMTVAEPTPSVDVMASLRPSMSSHRSHTSADAFHGNYSAALNALNLHRESDRSMFKPTVMSNKSPHRRIALALCDWRIGEDEIKSWEIEGRQSQAACWLLFTNQGGRAIDMLMRSKVESHQMMSAALAALLQQSSAKNHDLRAYCERLIIKLQDPHFRIMLSYVVFNDWTDVLEEEALPLRERLAIAFRFLDDRTLSSYLRRLTEECQSKGRIEGLVLTGLTPRGIDVLQSYVDTTGDVQTAAILSSLVCPGKFQDKRADRWLAAYHDLLDGWKLFYHRCQFDIDRGRIIQEGIRDGEGVPVEWAPKHFLIRCSFCSKAVNSQQPKDTTQRKRGTCCPWCGRALPRCSVCLMSVSITPDAGHEGDAFQTSFRDTIDDAFIFCQRCRHGGHAAHIIEWFFSEEGGEHPRRTCAVAGCDCLCDEE